MTTATISDLSEQRHSQRGMLFTGRAMTYLFVLIVAFMVFSVPVWAEEKTDLQMQDVREKILSHYADSKTWCGPKPPMPEKGEIVIFWTRNEKGQCVVPNYLVGK